MKPWHWPKLILSPIYCAFTISYSHQVSCWYNYFILDYIISKLKQVCNIKQYINYFQNTSHIIWESWKWQNIRDFVFAFDIWQQWFRFAIKRSITAVYLFVRCGRKELAKYFRYGIIYCNWSVVFVVFVKFKLFRAQFVYKFLVNLVMVNILLSPCIVAIVHAFGRLYKVYIACDIV